jgi:hypothetical protein
MEKSRHPKKISPTKLYTGAFAVTVYVVYSNYIYLRLYYISYVLYCTP